MTVDVKACTSYKISETASRSAPQPHLANLLSQKSKMNSLPTLIPALCPELLDLIADEVHCSHDLAQLALANKTLRDVVCPMHIDFRVIECALDDGSMWELLEANPRHIARVRTLKVHVTSMQKSPGISRNPPRGLSLNKKRILPLELLQRMSRLQSFEWLSVDNDGQARAGVSPQ